MYTMTQEQLESLVNIYNTLCTISTKGADTITMATCLQLLRSTVEKIDTQIVNIPSEEKKE